MSACNPCTRSITLPLCLDSFNIGFVSSNLPVFIYIKNHSTGRLIRLQDISSVNGLVIADTTDIVFNQNHSYEVWVTELESMSMEERLEMTMDDDTFTCVNLKFESVFDKDNVSTTYY